MKTLVLLLAVVVSANAMENFFWLGDYEDEMGEGKKGCCMPTQWEGRVGAVYITNSLLHSKTRASDSKVGVDFSGKKMAARSMFYCAKAKKVFVARTVVDYNSKKAYFIFKNKCETFNFNKPMRQPCIPDFFKKFPSYFYGAVNSSLAVTPYGFRNESIAVFAVVTQDTCVPVKAAFRVKHRYHSKVGSYQYFNITMGNTDKELYDVPDFCDNSNWTKPERSGIWRTFKNLFGYMKGDERAFSSSGALSSQVDGDALTQLMDIVNESADLMMDATSGRGYKRGASDRWYQMWKEGGRSEEPGEEQEESRED